MHLNDPTCSDSSWLYRRRYDAVISFYRPPTQRFNLSVGSFLHLAWSASSIKSAHHRLLSGPSPQCVWSWCSLFSTLSFTSLALSFTFSVRLSLWSRLCTPVIRRNFTESFYIKSLIIVILVRHWPSKDCHESYNILMFTHQRTRLPGKSNGRKNARQFSLIGRGFSTNGFLSGTGANLSGFKPFWWWQTHSVTQYAWRRPRWPGCLPDFQGQKIR